MHPDFRRQGVGSALLDQLRTNLFGLGVGRLRTEVDWDAPELLLFFQHEGFRPGARISLEILVKARD